MTTKQAIATAKAYLAKRKEVRKALLTAARAKHPHYDCSGRLRPATQLDYELRKLYHYPSDLTDQRLLDLIEA